MKWKVVQKYFDSAKVSALITEVNDDDKPVFGESHSNYDLYVDIFDNYQEALKFKEDALKA